MMLMNPGEFLLRTVEHKIGEGREVSFIFLGFKIKFKGHINTSTICLKLLYIKELGME